MFGDVWVCLRMFKDVWGYPMLSNIYLRILQVQIIISVEKYEISRDSKDTIDSQDKDLLYWDWF